MAKKRSESVKEKKGNIPAATRGGARNKTNGIAKRSSRPSTTTTYTEVKRGLKSTKVPSQKSQGNRGSCKEKSKQVPSRSGKKRNLSTQESSDSSTNKRPKGISSQEQHEDIFQTKEDDRHCSSDRKKAGQLKQLRKKEENFTRQTGTCNLIEEDTTEKSRGKQKSPLKCMPEATPENPQALTGNSNDKNVPKKLKLDLMERVEEQCPAGKEAREMSSESESSDDEGVAWEDVDEAHVADSVLETVHKEPGDNGASTSHEHHSPSKKSVEISITVPGSKKKKKGWDREEFMKYVKRAVNRFRKEVLTNVHKVHLLALVAHGIFRNGACNEPLIQGILLSQVPSDFASANKRKWDVARLTSFLKWFQSKFSSIDDTRTGDKETDKQIAKLENLSEVLVGTLRSLGFLTRLIYSMQAMSVKGNVEGNSNSNNQKKKMPKVSKTNKRTSEESPRTPAQPKKKKTAVNEDVKVENEVKTPARKSENGFDKTELNEEEVDKCVKKESRKLSKSNSVAKTSKRKSQIDSSNVETVVNKTKSGKKSAKKNKRPLRKRNKVDYSLCDSENEIDADEEWNDQSSDSDSVEESKEFNKTKEISKGKGKTPLARRKRSTGSDSGLLSENSSLSFVDLVDDDSDFEVTSKPLVRRPSSAGSSGGKGNAVKILSSDESDDSVKCLGNVSNEQGCNWWAEVYLPVEKRWICVHLESSSINHPELCEKQATQPLVYVVSFDNKTSIKDVTNRYASSWMSKTRKLRIDAEWWEDTLEPYKSKNKKMDEMEDSHLEDKLLEKPLPTSITEFKNHPLYVLKRHLLKFEAIYPETAAILGYCRGEAVYSRDCVHQLHTREKWLNEALVVKQGEKAYKVVKGRPKRNQPIHERDSVTIDLFGRWQTEKYKPPPAKDGKVPRNEYGNLELFQPCMLPPGTKHIQINGIQRVAKKLGIDCAQAVVGFDFHCGFSHPVIDGVVVCEEFEQVLLDAWREEEEQAEKRKAEKREKRMLANWRLLTRSLLIRERLKKRYDTEEPNVAETSNNAEDEVLADTAISWPLNRQEGKSSVANDGHCHVFPTSGHKQDPITGEWTKSCSCGLTLPFEKM